MVSTNLFSESSFSFVSELFDVYSSLKESSSSFRSAIFSFFRILVSLDLTPLSVRCGYIYSIMDVRDSRLSQ